MMVKSWPLFTIWLVLAPVAAAAQTQTNPFLGSVPTGKTSAEPLALTLKDTVNRALQHNLGLLLQEEALRQAHGAKWRALEDLLPNVSGSVSERRQLLNLEAFGLPVNPPIVGPFNVFDARLAVSHPIVESTDDAQIEGHITQISARLSGTIIKVNVTDNQSVAAGAILAQIDPRDYQVAVDRVRAELADAEANAAAAGTGVPVTAVSTRSDIRTATGALEEAEAGVTVADRQVEAAQAQLVAAQARMREQEATALKNTRDVERWKPLVAKEEISQQRFDAAVAAAEAARAAADAAKSDAAAAQTAVAVAQQRRSSPGRGRTRAGRAPGREDGARAGGDHQSACGERRCPRQAGASDARSGRIEPRANVDQGAHFGNRQSQGR
jgi:hypothetical protein